MKKYVLYLLVFAYIMPLHAQTYSKEERIYWLSNIWKDAGNYFHSPEYLKEIRWDSIYTSFIPKVVSASNDEDFFVCLQMFLASLQDGHTEVSWLDFWARSERTDYLPLDLDIVEGEIIVTATLPQSELPLGSKIKQINRMPAFQYLEKKIFPIVSAKNTPDKLERSLELLMIGDKKDSVLFEAETPENRLKEICLRYNAYTNNVSPREMNCLRSSNIKNINRTDIYAVKNTRDNYYYIRLDNFMKNSFLDLIRKREKEIAQSDYIILDLRRNRGGNEILADSLLMCFLDCDSLKTYKSVTRINHAFYAAMGYGFPEYKEYYMESKMDTLPEDILYKRNLPTFHNPLYILIGEKTYSAAEDLLLALKLNHPQRAILVGKPTGGSTGAPYVKRITPALYYRICTRKPVVPEGLFDNGISPDYFYEPTLKEVMEENDMIFEYVRKIHRGK